MAALEAADADGAPPGPGVLYSFTDFWDRPQQSYTGVANSVPNFAELRFETFKCEFPLKLGRPLSDEAPRKDEWQDHQQPILPQVVLHGNKEE